MIYSRMHNIIIAYAYYELVLQYSIITNSYAYG